MPLTITRPIGRRFDDTLVTATVTDSFMYAQFNRTAHGLVDGDFVHIVTPGPYEGTWVVASDNVNHFFLRPYANPSADFIAYFDVGTQEYSAASYTHMWSAVHLPIVYDIVSSMYPYSNASNRTISSFDNANGMMRLSLSGGMSALPLEYVRIVGAASPELNGIWQIKNVESSNRYTINMAYDAGLDKTGAVVTNYYNNYSVLVKVYAGWPGIPGKEGYVRRTILRFRPNENNAIRFSISDVLKSFVASVNDLNPGAWPLAYPNNYHNSVQFYLRYQEVYDEASGGVIVQHVSEEVSDEEDYEGMAINCKLNFRNLYSGYLSDYLMNTRTAKFLTLFAIPVLFACQDAEPDCYQDISFLSPEGGGKLHRQYLVKGQVLTTIDETISDEGPGVYRVPLMYKGVNACAYDELIVSLTQSYQPFVTFSVGKQRDFNGAAPWTGSGPWQQTIGLDGGMPYTDIMYGDDQPYLAGTYVINVAATRLSGTAPVSWYIVGMDAAGNILYNNLLSVTAGPGQYIVTLPVDAARIGLRAQATSGTNPTVQITSMSFELSQKPASEEKRIRIDCGCSNQQIRLTWLNNLGGFDYWTFKGQKENLVDIYDSGETTKNILPGWPYSYDENADTIRRNTYRVSRGQVLIRSDYVSAQEVEALAYIKSSILVQIMEGRKKRTVIVDTNSWVVRRDADKLNSIEFTATYTDDIPSQTT